MNVMWLSWSFKEFKACSAAEQSWKKKRKEKKIRAVVQSKYVWMGQLSNYIVKPWLSVVSPKGWLNSGSGCVYLAVSLNSFSCPPTEKQVFLLAWQIVWERDVTSEPNNTQQLSKRLVKQRTSPYWLCWLSTVMHWSENHCKQRRMQAPMLQRTKRSFNTKNATYIFSEFSFYFMTTTTTF